MAIMVLLLLLVPALIGLMCYERFKGVSFSLVKRIELFLIFAFVTNMGVYGIIWVRKWDFLSWSLDNMSTVTDVGFVFQYMVMSLVVTVVAAYVLSLIRIGKSKGGIADISDPEETDDAKQEETGQEDTEQDISDEEY